MLAYVSRLTSCVSVFTLVPMPTKQPKFRNRGESTHWSRVQAAALNRWNWPAKRKTNVDYAIRLTSQIADASLEQFRLRTERNGK